MALSAMTAFPAAAQFFCSSLSIWRTGAQCLPNNADALQWPLSAELGGLVE